MECATVVHVRWLAKRKGVGYPLAQRARFKGDWTMGRFLICTAGAAVLLPAAAQAQSDSEMTIYLHGHFSGPSITLSGPMRNIDPEFTAKSVKITGDSAWELCNGATFTHCRRVDKSVESGVFSVRSARPIAPIIVNRISGSPNSPTGAGGSPPNLSLRGVDSEFFVAPNRGGQRVSVAGNNPEGMRKAADEFCRNAGWRMSAHARLQSEGGTYYLVDVLCANSE